jgi:hypothetical protein
VPRIGTCGIPSRIRECLVPGLIPMTLVRISMAELVTLRSTQAPSVVCNQSRKLRRKISREERAAKLLGIPTSADPRLVSEGGNE